MFILFILLMSTSLTHCESLEQVFTNIYNNPPWGGGKETVSGGGSTLSATTNIRLIIPKLFKEFGIKKVLDAPCGDFNWMSSIDLSDLEHYIGVDIVHDLIEKNKDKYETNNISFFQKNLAEDNLPDVDLIFCRDLFIHLKYEDIFKTLKNFKKNSAKYLLVSTYAIPENKDRKEAGAQYRPINLLLPPFNFPEPLRLIEDSKRSKKYLGLWQCSDIPDEYAS